MTDSLFFDADCISSFLWVEQESLLSQLYSGRIVIPRPVYVELSYPRTPHLKARTDALVASGHAEIIDIIVGTEEYNIYHKLTVEPEKGRKLIGKGEAASIALAKEKDGIVASNNFRDINDYIQEYRLDHITTGEVLVDALNKKLITVKEGDVIWAAMLRKRRKIGAATFSEFLKSNSNKNCKIT